ncbi:MAG: flavin-containing monooxygenase [Paracoccaceae bacterium]
MPIKEVDTIVVGAGQAGIAMSEHLTANGIDHLIFERDRIAESWRTRRWDSLVANGPAWHDRFPSLDFEGHSGEDFVSKDTVVSYFETYVAHINAPVKCGVDVTQVTRDGTYGGFTVSTSCGLYRAKHIVAATGAFQTPVMPPIIPEEAGLQQMHSADYRNPDQLREGAVLVVGGGSSGAQIAQELMESGRKTFISISPHDRPPRRYRDRDNVWWLGVLGKWEMPTPAPGTEHVTFAVSGKDGGHTIDFRKFAASGMVLLGMTQAYDNGVLTFADDLQANIAHGDKNYLSVLEEADDFVRRNNLDLPEDLEARKSWPDPESLTNPIYALDLARENITSVIWATGYKLDFGWLDIGEYDVRGRPLHSRGISSEPGLYFVGLPWLSRRGSSFIWGVWHDAKFIADQIAIQHAYLDYRPPAKR